MVKTASDAIRDGDQLMTVLIILGVLFLSLLVILPLLEKMQFRMSDESQAKMSRWILPLLVIVAVVQLIMYAAG
jgi:hypothetical protein